MEQKIIEELQRIVDSIKDSKENGEDEMFRTYMEYWVINRNFAESILDKTVSFKNWKVVVK